MKTVLLVLATSVMMTACIDKEKNKLDNRVVDYWNAKINKDFDQAYQFLSPGWRSNESELGYKQRIAMSKVKWLGVKLVKKSCAQKDFCKLTLEIKYEYQFKGAFSDKMIVSSQVEENWIMKKNKWYHVPTEKKLQ